jgi:hypothetical protein
MPVLRTLQQSPRSVSPAIKVPGLFGVFGIGGSG